MGVGKWFSPSNFKPEIEVKNKMGKIIVDMEKATVNGEDCSWIENLTDEEMNEFVPIIHKWFKSRVSLSDIFLKGVLFLYSLFMVLCFLHYTRNGIKKMKDWYSSQKSK